MDLVSRDVTWLDQVHGEFNSTHDTPASVTASLADLNWKGKGKGPGRVAPTAPVAPPTPTTPNAPSSPSKNTRSSGPQPLDASKIEPNSGALKALRQLRGVS
jgi:hypothetical protein